VPIAYLTHHKEFFDLDFVVNKNVLIPRPQTEILVEEILKNKNIKTIADIGTGSGCIAVALAKNRPHWQVYATDVSAPALRVARANAKKNHVKINFKKGDLIKPLKNIMLDAVVANLPYLPNKLKTHLNTPETRGLKFEPARALFSGPDGLDLLKKFFQQLEEREQKPKYIYLEFDPNQTAYIRTVAERFNSQYQSHLIWVPPQPKCFRG
jgi:release factor glutamine methyltransferase